MSALSSAFATLVRRATDTCFRYFCDRCRAETLWRLVAEDTTHEYYQCENCQAEKGWKVR